MAISEEERKKRKAEYRRSKKGKQQSKESYQRKKARNEKLKNVPQTLKPLAKKILLDKEKKERESKKAKRTQIIIAKFYHIGTVMHHQMGQSCRNVYMAAKTFAQ